MLFLCGVEVEVSFSALYSNVLVAFATVKAQGPRTQDCTVTLTSLPVNRFFFSVQLQFRAMTFCYHTTFGTSLNFQLLKPVSTSKQELHNDDHSPTHLSLRMF